MNRQQHTGQFFHCIVGQYPSCLEAKLLSVPFFRHDAENAGPAALAMILNFYGRRIGVRRVVDEVGEGWRGPTAIPRVLADAAQDYGFNSRVVSGDICRLEEWLGRGIPPLIFSSGAGQAAGEPVAVVTGISAARDAVRVHYRTTPHQWLRAAEFLGLCGGEAFTAVLVTEKVRPVSRKSFERLWPFFNGFRPAAPTLDYVSAMAA